RHELRAEDRIRGDRAHVLERDGRGSTLRSRRLGDLAVVATNEDSPVREKQERAPTHEFSLADVDRRRDARTRQSVVARVTSRAVESYRSPLLAPCRARVRHPGLPRMRVIPVWETLLPAAPKGVSP